MHVIRGVLFKAVQDLGHDALFLGRLERHILQCVAGDWRDGVRHRDQHGCTCAAGHVLLLPPPCARLVAHGEERSRSCSARGSIRKKRPPGSSQATRASARGKLSATNLAQNIRNVVHGHVSLIGVPVRDLRCAERSKRVHDPKGARWRKTNAGGECRAASKKRSRPSQWTQRYCATRGAPFLSLSFPLIYLSISSFFHLALTAAKRV